MANTVIVNIQRHAFPKVSIPRDTYIVWRNQDASIHSAETRGDASFFFNAGAMRKGELSSPVYFGDPGAFPYLCRFHAPMEGTIEVTLDGAVVVEPQPGRDQGESGEGGGGHGGHHESQEATGDAAHRADTQDPFNHLHGFVTGGRSGKKLFMTHTPVLADPRHSWQVILRASFIKENHAAAYERLRSSDYGHGLVQIFHEHVSMPGIARSRVTELPRASVSYYPDGKQTDAPGFPEEVPISIDRVIHSHEFDLDAPYPPALEYLMYGDDDDVFVDHYMMRAPSFHSVAKLAHPPAFWEGPEDALRFTVPSKQIRELAPRTLSRTAFVDNAFHLVWLPPPGLIPPPQDPLKRRDGGLAVHRVRTADGQEGEIEIRADGFLHMDVRLLNYGVLIPPEQRT